MENLPPKKNYKKYVSIPTYARLCAVEVNTIYARLDKLDESILRETELAEVEGKFINTQRYPPIKFNRGWKKGRKRKVAELSEETMKEKEPEINLEKYIEETRKLIPQYNIDLETFQGFMSERHKAVKEKITLIDFYRKVTNKEKNEN